MRGIIGRCLPAGRSTSLWFKHLNDYLSTTGTKAKSLPGALSKRDHSFSRSSSRHLLPAESFPVSSALSNCPSVYLSLQ